jgi:hypothetical protein
MYAGTPYRIKLFLAKLVPHLLEKGYTSWKEED